ncbi:energy transducer TonB [Chryseobacterium sp. SN22]|uniref:energy transducer TonB n=1 Tax=Chryseobacterium sp. SN22 TaxID=2606431 RepID=UPI0011ECE973|nr:energy transducer TonB [Chryseobacterium sp. SN22]KAA0128661.1 energy transducer TonB [Chryseobacterium sp. SN22]
MKNMHQNQEVRFNEILFEHRNKEYGAYVLRNESDRILTKALFVGVSLLAAVSITPIIMNAFKSNSESTIICTYPGPIMLDNVDTPEIPVQVTQVQPTKPEVKTYDSSVPTPSRQTPDTRTEKIPDDAIAGLSNNFKADPAPQNTYVPSTPTIGTGPVINTAPPVVIPKEDPNKIATGDEIGQEAGFIGGIDAFRNKVMNNFDTSGLASDDVMKTMITFIVERDGSISAIKANGLDADFNNEAIRTIKSIKGKWIPGKNKKGESVRSYFKFPISMKLDN